MKSQCSRVSPNMFLLMMFCKWYSSVKAIQSNEIKLSSCPNALYVPNSGNDTAWFKGYRCSTAQWTWSAMLYVTLSLPVWSLLFNVMYVLAAGRLKELQWVTWLARFGLLACWEVQCFGKYFLLILEVNRRWRCSAIRKPASLPTLVVQLREEKWYSYGWRHLTRIWLGSRASCLVEFWLAEDICGQWFVQVTDNYNDQIWFACTSFSFIQCLQLYSPEHNQIA